jgi:hypothetical protein
MSKLSIRDNPDSVSTPKTVSQGSVKGNPSKAELILENDFLLPMGSAAETLDRLENLFATIALLAALARKSQTIDVYDDLLRIESLCKTGRFVADDQGNFCDCMHERARDEHAPALLALLHGPAQ